MIEFIENGNREGYLSISVQAEGLPMRRDPKDFRYHITVRPDGWCETRSRANGAGSVRYYNFRTYAEAQAHATKWVKRKIAGR